MELSSLDAVGSLQLQMAEHLSDNHFNKSQFIKKQDKLLISG
jgi:hypothetical protein